ncbi:hypothetical protein GN956_G12546 [Arapaima gigas]
MFASHWAPSVIKDCLVHPLLAARSHPRSALPRTAAKNKRQQKSSQDDRKSCDLKMCTFILSDLFCWIKKAFWQLSTSGSSHRQIYTVSALLLCITPEFKQLFQKKREKSMYISKYNQLLLHLLFQC